MANQNCEHLQKLVDELLKKQKESKENEDTLQEYFVALEEDKNELFGKLVDVQTKLDESEIKVSEVKLSLSESIIENENLIKQLKELGNKFKKCRELYLNNSNELKRKKDQISYLESQFVDITTKNIEDESRYKELKRNKENNDRYNLKIISNLSSEKLELIKRLISSMLRNRKKTKLQKDIFYCILKRIKFKKECYGKSKKIQEDNYKKKILEYKRKNDDLKKVNLQFKRENDELNTTINYYYNIVPALKHQIQCLTHNNTAYIHYY